MITTKPKTTAPAASGVHAKPIMIDMASIRLDGGTQSRARINQETADEYAEAAREGAKFPAVVVFHDGETYWLADGFHRHAAHTTAGKKKILAEVRQGTQRDAILHSVGANAVHGLRRSNDDKRRAVMTLLNDEEWRQKGSGWIAERCGVTDRYVRKLIEETGVSRNSSGIEVTRGGTTYVMNTSAIGKTGGDERQEIAAETVTPQAVEGGVEPSVAVEEIALGEPAAEVPVSDDPFDHEEGTWIPSEVEPVTSQAPEVTQAETAEQVDVAPVTQAAGNYVRMLVHTKIRGFDAFCKEHAPDFMATGVSADEVASMRTLAGRVNRWLEAFVAAAKNSQRPAA